VLVYVGPRATHFTVYSCWFMWGLGQHTLLGIVIGSCGAMGTLLCIDLGLCGGLGQHTLLGIVVGLCGPGRASGNTCYWV
jgi:hypothetical protein